MNFNVTQKEFNRHLFKLISSYNYMYKFLIHEVEKCMHGDTIFYDDSLLNIHGEGWILIIHSESIMIYGHMWSSKQFEEIKKEFDLNMFTNYLITGDSYLIKAMIEFYKIDNFIIEMERIFYRANSIILFNAQDLKISQPKEIDINSLASMLQQYYHEEYDGENDKSLEEMSSRIQTSISKNKIYTLKNRENEILSFCTIIDPDIGIFFTNIEFRNKGYGKIILSHCSDILLQHNEEIYLMTVKSKVESNAACQRVGFKNYFEYSYIRINNS